MKASMLISVLAFITMSYQLDNQKRGWQGIIPLHSTIDDVVRILGPGSEQPNKSMRFYKTASENISIRYSEGSCVGATGWNVPLNTVVDIEIHPQPYGRVKIVDLKIDKAKFKREDDSHLPNHYYLINENDGITIYVFKHQTTGEDLVSSFNYGPAARDKDLRCKQK